MKITLARSTFCLALLFALGIMSMEHARSGPPSPPPSAPGKILFNYGATATIWEMNGNGTGQSNLELSADPSVPSAILHGPGPDSGRRWWLIHMEPNSVGNSDPNNPNLGVTNGITTIRLTNSGSIVNPDGTTQTHVKFSFGGKPSWSNDGADSFCSVNAFRYVLGPATNVITDQQTAIYRLNISVDDWTRITNPSSVLGPFTPFSHHGDSRITSVIKTALPHGTITLGGHHWRPDGKAITFTNGNWKVQTGADLFVTNLLDPVTLVPVSEVDADLLKPIVYHQVNYPFGVTGPRWCPTTGDNRILYQSYGQICTILPGNPVINLASGGQLSPFWSPDRVYVVYEKKTTKGFNNTYNVWRVPSSGGTGVNLTSNLDPARRKDLRGWSW